MPETTWPTFLKKELASPYGQLLRSFIKQERRSGTVYPAAKQTFAAFTLTPFESVKAVILGQDPYHGPGLATGLAFSVPADQRKPPSLDNILKEYSDDLQVSLPTSGDLSKWAERGVLLLNSTLTVRAHSPMSHTESGWERLTSAALSKISKERSDIVFILWGNHAQKLAANVIDATKHMIIKSPHPSPLSAYKGFLGSKPFSRTNEFLVSKNLQPINWLLN